VTPLPQGALISVGVDVGGTFTDLVAVGTDGHVRSAKVLTTPVDRAIGVAHAVEQAALDSAAVARFVHGTTVVTNLLLERAGTRVVLLATEGFTDLLWLRRQERASLYDLTRDHPEPLIVREDVIGVNERVAPRWYENGRKRDAPDGVELLHALTEAEVARVVAQARASGATAFAVVLLHAHVFAAHEAQLGRALRAACPDATIALSHEVLPEIREYERSATTVAEAYARPAVASYMHGLTQMLTARGLPEPRVMTSAGGTLAASEAAEHAASLALSGPAGGITAAAALCRAIDVRDALTIDIGGTSADVGLIVDGEPLVERGGVLAGVPIALPRVLVETVAAGGGSLARIDAGGALHAGPESAGAEPGPACYARGGNRATVTDAHVVLGHIAAGTWSSAVTIDAMRARAVLERLAATLQRSVDDSARALIATADATMARALRRVSVERGRDPRDMVLVAFGGGGPLHACGLADALGMRRIFIPPFAGVLSALGLALAPERRDGVSSIMQRSDLLPDAALQQARLALVHQLRQEREDLNDRVWARVRYLGQGHELEVPLFDTDSVVMLTTRFHALHQARFGFVLDRVPEVVGLRATLEGAWWPLRVHREARQETRGEAPETTLVEAREHTFEFTDVDDGFTLDVTRDGPCTVRLPDATLRVANGWRAKSLMSGGWWIEREDIA
jgi:N-methylhydantoinase A